MNKKQLYETPQAELIVVRFEENILSPDGSWDNSIENGTKWGADDDDYGME